LAKYQIPKNQVPGYLPSASFVKDRSTHHIFALERISNFTICSLLCQVKSGYFLTENSIAVRVEQAIHACGKSSKFPFLAPAARAQRNGVR
jgi:hypothetical protein